MMQPIEREGKVIGYFVPADMGTIVLDRKKQRVLNIDNDGVVYRHGQVAEQPIEWYLRV